MPEFCYDCSIRMFGTDFKDLAHGKIGRISYTICEGCGPGSFDWAGRKAEFIKSYEDILI